MWYTHYMSERTSIQTYSGKAFDVSSPTQDMICIEDIAHALSQVNRFTGHTKRPYSVAEHSVRVSRLLVPQLALEGLLHDASEAYLADMSTPVKKTVNMQGYLDLESTVQTVCEHKFEVYSTPNSHAVVKYADLLMLKAEALTLLNQPLIDAWKNHISSIRIPDSFNEWPEGWTPKRAEKMFLKTFANLTRNRVQ